MKDKLRALANRAGRRSANSWLDPELTKSILVCAILVGMGSRRCGSQIRTTRTWPPGFGPSRKEVLGSRKRRFRSWQRD